MDGGTSEVKVDITVDVDVVLLVGGLDLTALLAGLWGKLCVEGELQALGQLVLDCDFCSQSIVGVPLLLEGQTCEEQSNLVVIYPFAIKICVLITTVQMIWTSYQFASSCHQVD